MTRNKSAVPAVVSKGDHVAGLILVMRPGAIGSAVEPRMSAVDERKRAAAVSAMVATAASKQHTESDGALSSIRRVGNVVAYFAICLLPGIGPAIAADAVPLPRERPAAANDQSASSDSEWTACDQRLTELAEFRALPPIAGPGECTAGDVVQLDAVRLPDDMRVTLTPPATLRCPMAEAVAHWIRDDIAPAVAALGTSVRGIETADSFDCRPRNSIPGAKISEHGHANALDVSAFKLSNRKSIELTKAHESKSLRQRFRDSACARFSTVLGNGADAYHETHVHLDLIARHDDYRICQWDVLDESQVAVRAAAKTVQAAQLPKPDTPNIPLPRPRPRTNSQVPSPERHASAGASRSLRANR